MRDRNYFRTLNERFGFLPAYLEATAPGAIWLHAVSVGEVLSAVELVRRLRTALPGERVYVSCSTLAGRAAAEARLKDIVDGLLYAPFDYVFAVRRVLRRLRPAVLIVLETEIWPNLYREAKRFGASLVIVNGRMSPRTAPRYARLRSFLREVLTLPDAILVQSDADRGRFLRAGAQQVEVAGNLKYDFDPMDGAVPDDVEHFFSGRVWIAASTVAPEYSGDIDEDDVVIETFRALAGRFPDLRLVIAPRKPDRFDIVAAKLNGLPFSRRTTLDPSKPVLLLDSIGELSSLFRRADVVFMGGTLADRGGHNVLEPAMFGKPVIAGPNLENFPDVEERFMQTNALIRIDKPEHLVSVVDSLLRNPVHAADMGARARRAAESQRGVTDRAVAVISHAWIAAEPRRVGRLGILSRAWRFGAAWKRRDVQPRRLSRPVISVGGIAMGGSGKTPFVAWLARKFAADGMRPAILTRGYKRRVAQRSTIIPAGVEAPVDLTGDEAQVLLRRGVAHLGIGAHRWAVGRELEQRLAPDVFLLDDGFQHSALGRDLDIVVIDALDPFAGGAVFPLGRLREAPEALARAEIIVITRAAADHRFEAARRRIRRLNGDAPIFRSTVRPVAWRSRTGEALDVHAFSGAGAVAFCGLANPEAFWRTLDQIGCVAIRRIAFPDHHRYTVQELEPLRAPVLLTTEKDLMNVPSELSVPLYWLEIAVDIENESSLWHAIKDRTK
jgi:tetraacyldisaccharide 4'-kinase